MKPTIDTGHCQCTAVHFVIKSKPLLRLYCHCRYCQSFNEAEFADVMIFRLGAVSMPDPKAIEYQSYRRFFGVQRGKCRQCATPAIEYLRLPLGLSLAIVPSNNLARLCEQQKPALHLYYHRSVNKYEDELPKYEGHWRSQLMLGASLLKALSKR